MDSTQNFSGRAEAYDAGRPAYAFKLIDSLYTKYGFSEKSVIADIGSGTGKFAKQLLDRGSSVICVEPNDDMRNIAEIKLSRYKNFQTVNGTANYTTLSSGCVDFITTAQAFHWFDVEMFQKECKRIIKPNGKVILVWNIRDMSSMLNRESYETYLKYCPNFQGFSGGIKENDEKIKLFFHDRYEYVLFPNPLYFDKSKFIRRSLSSSYSLKENERNYQKYLNALIILFDKYANHGILEMPNQTVAYIGEL